MHGGARSAKAPSEVVFQSILRRHPHVTSLLHIKSGSIRLRSRSASMHAAVYVRTYVYACECVNVCVYVRSIKVAIPGPSFGVRATYFTLACRCSHALSMTRMTFAHRSGWDMRFEASGREKQGGATDVSLPLYVCFLEKRGQIERETPSQPIICALLLHPASPSALFKVPGRRTISSNAKSSRTVP
jgi:hypothetical protein